MKLASYQINAILDEIDSKRKEVTAKKKAELTKKWTPEAKKMARKAAAGILVIPKFLRGDLLYGSNHTVAELTARIIRAKLNSLKPATPLCDRESLRRKIILASIDSSTVEELKRKLNIKF
jgi:hypothetical protein